MNKAFFVTANVTARVIIDVENDKLTDMEHDILLAKAKKELMEELNDNYRNCIEDTREAVECPYNEEIDKV